jgi:hypothetical protein
MIAMASWQSRFPKRIEILNCSRLIVDVASSRSRESFEMIQRHR